VQFVAPSNIRAAVHQLATAKGEICVLAGGTDLIVQMQSGIRKPDLIVDIKRIPEVRMITESKAGFRIGSAVCGAEISEHMALRAAWPGFVEATDVIGSMQVQSRATPAGNLCNASPAADSVPAMVAAGAIVEIAGPTGRRRVPVEDIPVGPGKTSLQKGEFIVAIHLRPRKPRSGDAYLRFTPRTEMDIAVVSAAVNLTLDETGICLAARIAIGAVAPTVLLVHEAGAALLGTRVDDASLENAASAVRAACRPIDDKRGTAEYRTQISGVIFKRAAAIALQRARSRETES
jgi:CO/xanthine dehydrogenase FAD-binding subunit